MPRKAKLHASREAVEEVRKKIFRSASVYQFKDIVAITHYSYIYVWMILQALLQDGEIIRVSKGLYTRRTY